MQSYSVLHKIAWLGAPFPQRCTESLQCKPSTVTCRVLLAAATVAAEILATARGIAEGSPDEPSDTLSQIRQSVEKATSIGQEIVTNDEDAETLKETGRHIMRGLEALENQALTSASSFSLESSLNQRSAIQIRTQEGDVVKFALGQAERLSATDIAVESQSGSVRLTEVSVSSRSRFILNVDGDLNEAELAAITNLIAQAEKWPRNYSRET